MPLEKFITICYNQSAKGHLKNSKRSRFMLTTQVTKEKATKSKFNDEFENYLKKQCLKTTFNGIELETFSWYKKVLGLI